MAMKIFVMDPWAARVSAGGVRPAQMSGTPCSNPGVLSCTQVTTDLRHRCTDGHTGTSVSAPMVAGIIALALEAKSVPEISTVTLTSVSLHNCCDQ